MKHPFEPGERCYSPLPTFLQQSLRQHRHRHLYPAPDSRHAGDGGWGEPMKAILRSGFLALAIKALTVPASAGPFEDSKAAHGRGDYETALKILQPFAEQGDAWAQTILGIMYAKGEGVSEDFAEAVKWYREAAEQGDADAQHNLGSMYALGQGVSEDFAEAVKWWLLTAEQGHAKAQATLGLMYYSGLGVAEDDAEAVKWYRKAAEQGSAIAQNYLGLMYAKGEGVSEDFAEAVKWWLLAAEQGHATSQNSLGISYSLGHGVPQDFVEAAKWLRLAAEQGDATAQYNLGNDYVSGSDDRETCRRIITSGIDAVGGSTTGTGHRYLWRSNAEQINFVTGRQTGGRSLYRRSSQIGRDQCLTLAGNFNWRSQCRPHAGNFNRRRFNQSSWLDLRRA